MKQGAPSLRGSQLASRGLCGAGLGLGGWERGSGGLGWGRGVGQAEHPRRRGLSLRGNCKDDHGPWPRRGGGQPAWGPASSRLPGRGWANLALRLTAACLLRLQGFQQKLAHAPHLGRSWFSPTGGGKGHVAAAAVGWGLDGWLAISARPTGREAPHSSVLPLREVTAELVRARVCVHACVHVCLHVCMHMHVHVYVFACACTLCTCMRVHRCAHVYVCVCACVLHVYMCMHVHVCAHTCVCVWWRSVTQTDLPPEPSSRARAMVPVGLGSWLAGGSQEATGRRTPRVLCTSCARPDHRPAAVLSLIERLLPASATLPVRPRMSWELMARGESSPGHSTRGPDLTSPKWSATGGCSVSDLHGVLQHSCDVSHRSSPLLEDVFPDSPHGSFGEHSM